MIEPSLIIAGVVVVAVLVLTSVIITTFLRSVDAGEILLASRGRNLKIYRGPSKALIVPVITQVRDTGAGHQRRHRDHRPDRRRRCQWSFGAGEGHRARLGHRQRR